MKLEIKCPTCSGKGKIKALDGVTCDYCHGEKTVLLTTYLKTLGKNKELANVLHFQKRTSKKQNVTHGTRP